MSMSFHMQFKLILCRVPCNPLYERSSLFSAVFNYHQQLEIMKEIREITVLHSMFHKMHASLPNPNC